MHLENNIMANHRRGFIGGSDAMRIMRDDWVDLYLEKVGEQAPADLSDIFKVQLGIRSEYFHAEWFTKMKGLKTEMANDMRHHQEHSWMCANLDRWLPEVDTFLEMKHSSNSANCRDKARYYMAQLQHYMAVCDVDQCYFSVIRGNDEPDICIVERNNYYIETLIKTEKAFWWHVTNKVKPDITPKATLKAAEKMIETIRVDNMYVMDMTSNNLWAELSGKILATSEAAKIYDDSKNHLRTLIAPDVSEAYGHGITAKRDKRDRLIIRQTKGE